MEIEQAHSHAAASVSVSRGKKRLPRYPTGMGTWETLIPREYQISGNMPDIPRNGTSIMQCKCAGLICKACTWKDIEALGRYVSHPPSLGVPDLKSRLA